MFDIIKRQKDFSFYLAIFQIEATGDFFKNKVQSQAIFTYFTKFVEFRERRIINLNYTKLIYTHISFSYKVFLRYIQL